jgi:hypothetical protein
MLVISINGFLLDLGTSASDEENEYGSAALFQALLFIDFDFDKRL